MRAAGVTVAMAAVAAQMRPGLSAVDRSASRCVAGSAGSAPRCMARQRGRSGSRPDAAHVVARIVEVEHPLRDFRSRSARSASSAGIPTEGRTAANVLGQLVFAAVMVEVPFLHSRSSDCSLSPASNPSCRLSQWRRQRLRGGVAALEVEGALRLARPSQASSYIHAV